MTIQALYPDISPSLSLDFANVKQLDPRVTFARASTARYYDGKTVAKAEENLLINSQDITATGWTNTGTTGVANSTTAPDGTTTADLLSETTANSSHFLITGNGVATSISGLSYAYSVFLKKGTGASAPDIIQITFRAGGFIPVPYANFDISVGGATSGTLTDSSAGATATITPVGNDWYRCTLLGVATSNSSNAGIAVVFVNNNPTGTRTPTYTGDTAADVFVWGAQLEQRSAVTAYTATTTQPITNYIPVLLSAANNEARFDHNPTTSESLGLLIEEQRSNLVLRSEEFDNASWAKNNSSITANTVVAPNGTLSGDRLVENTANSVHEISQASLVITAGATITNSLYVKASGRTSFELRMFSSADGFFSTFNLTNVTSSTGVTGTASVAGSSIVDVGNGWYRVSITGVVSASATSLQMRLRLRDNLGVSYTGDGFSGIFIWGAQLEVGAFPTSYIPTVASQVTRSADVQSATNLGQLGQGTFYIDATVRSGNTLITSGGTTFSATAGTRQKTAVAYNTTDTRKSINGATVTSTAGTQGGSNITIANGATGHINKIALYPQKLTDTNLQALTT
jgi:hypothetical protein